MCLYVDISHVAEPIPEMECFKILRYSGNGKWVTPYMCTVAKKGHGWFKPTKPARSRSKEFARNDTVSGGYIHAFYKEQNAKNSFYHPNVRVYDQLPGSPKVGREYLFRAVARDVVAKGDYWGDLVCKALYIPAFDKTGQHRNAILDMSI